MYVCPDCKGQLVNFRCAKCGTTFEVREGIPELLSRDPKFAAARTISATYDRIYTERAQVWEDQGRTPEFIDYFSRLCAQLATGSLLEIGCGEGFLLERLQAASKNAIDISGRALAKATRRSGASGAIALAERLPFADASFEIAVSVGVMEHFLDDRAAVAEIARALKPAGYYVTLIHVKRSRGEKAAQKVREYLYPRFRPVALLRWLTGKIYKPIHQPIQHDYSVAGAAEILRSGGLKVLRTISLETEKAAPLVGPHVVIYVAQRAAA